MNFSANKKEFVDVNENKGIVQFLIPIACFATIISQLPVFTDAGLSSAISTVVWVLVLFALALTQRTFTFYKQIKLPLILSIVVLLFWLMACAFDDSYKDSALARQIALSMFILLIGLFYGAKLSKKTLYKAFSLYIFASLIVTASVYVQFLRGADISDLTYAYASKNSISQIIFTSIILILTNKIFVKNVIMKIIYILIALFDVYALILLKSRATLVMIPIIIVVLLSSFKINKKIKRIIILVLIAMVLIYLFNAELVDTLINDVLFAGRKDQGIDSITSGRFSQWENFWEDFSKYPVFGKGGQHRESIILTSYLEYGFFFGTLILIVAFYPIYWCIRHFDKKDDLYPTILLISICYATNGVFEMLAPFGPGAKCFMLWFLVGALTPYANKIKNGS